MRERTERLAAGDRLVRVGVAVFAVGVLAILVTVVPLLLGTARLPLAFYLLSMLAPVGMGIARSGRVGAARARRRPSRVRADDDGQR